MADPLAEVTSFTVSQTASAAFITVFGANLGLSPDILFAGFCGSVTSILLLNSVPSTGDTLYELLRTSVRRLGVSIGSTMMAGYTAPMVALINGIPNPYILGLSFVLGAGAMKILPKLIDRFGDGPRNGAAEAPK